MTPCLHISHFKFYYPLLVDSDLDMAPCLHVITHMDMEMTPCPHIIAAMDMDMNPCLHNLSF